MRRRNFLQTCGMAASVPVVGVGVSRGGRGNRVERTQSGYEPYGSVEVDGAKEAAVHHDGDVAYVAAADGFASVDISDPEEPTVMAEIRDFDTESEMAHSNAPLEVIFDAWPDGDRLVVAGPANQAPGAAHGFALFDISDPAEPKQVAWYATSYHIHNSFFEDGIVYLTGSGLRQKPVVMVDVSDDEPEEIGRWSVADYSQEWADVSITSRVLHDVYVQDGVAYLPYWDSGTWLLDVSDPANPEVLSRVGDYERAELAEFTQREALQQYLIPDGNAHYAQVNDDGTIMVTGKEAWARNVNGDTIGGPGGFDLWDVSDKTAPEHLSHIEAPESFDQTTGGWFTTAHNADMVGDRLYTSWYFGGVKVYDVSDPANPEEIAWWRDPSETSFWTAQVANPGETFIASTANVQAVFDGYNPTGEALYTFPDRRGTQESPQDLTDPSSDPGPTETDSTPTSTPTPTPTQSSTPTPTPVSVTQTQEQTATQTDTPTSSGDGDGPGFAVGSALAGLGGLSYLLKRRLSADE
jgi:hypothetical protein